MTGGSCGPQVTCNYLIKAHIKKYGHLCSEWQLKGCCDFMREDNFLLKIDNEHENKETQQEVEIEKDVSVCLTKVYKTF